MEESRPGEYLPVEEDERGTYILNSKDLCMIGHIPELVDAGVASLKIEGRMKTALYVAVTAAAYRRAIDDFFESEEKYRSNIPEYEREISMCTTRDFTTGFYFRKPDGNDQIYTANTYKQGAVFLGMIEKVDEDGGVHIFQKNKFSVGDEIEVMRFRDTAVSAKVERIVNEEGLDVESAPHPLEPLKLWLSGTDGEILPGMMLRKKQI